MLRYKNYSLSTFRQSLKEIEDYLNEVAPNATIRFLDELNQQINSILLMPFLYPPYEYDNRFRKMVMTEWRYTLIYIVDKEKHAVIIYDIIHQSRNVPEVLLEKFPINAR